EHAFAALKGRFQSLCELHLWIQTEEDLHVAVYWVESCLILHNMIVQFEEGCHGEMEGTVQWAISEGQGSVDRDEEIHPGQPTGMEGQRFWAHLMQKLFNEHGLRL
ncbi:hypothetical protein PAXRUDRAFT_172694, partial [Paxillus rubicundulus Ve08.2h10]